MEFCHPQKLTCYNVLFVSNNMNNKKRYKLELNFQTKIKKKHKNVKTNTKFFKVLIKRISSKVTLKMHLLLKITYLWPNKTLKHIKRKLFVNK